MPREAVLARTLVELADTLVDDFDVVELLTLLADRCVEMLDVAAAGLMLAAPEGDLRVVASSSEAMRLVELFELQSEEGPCPDCFRTGEPAFSTSLASDTERWPRFGPVALEAGFQSVHALPMRLRGVTIGALNLFRADEGALDEADIVAAQALADVATIGILQHRAADSGPHRGRSAQLRPEQPHPDRAGQGDARRTSRSRHGTRPSPGCGKHARSHNLLLVDVAQSVIDGTVSPESSHLGSGREISPRSA